MQVTDDLRRVAESQGGSGPLAGCCWFYKYCEADLCEGIPLYFESALTSFLEGAALVPSQGFHGLGASSLDRDDATAFVAGVSFRLLSVLVIVAFLWWAAAG